MQTVGIKALKNNLSEYIRAAAAGEIVRVTDRGRIVAEIVPAGAAAGADPEQRLAELVRQGLVTPARRRLAGPPPHVAVAGHDELLQELGADREDR